MGSVNDFDLTALYDENKSLNEGALTIPGYSMEGWYGRIFRGCGFFDPDKPIKKYTKSACRDFFPSRGGHRLCRVLLHGGIL
jgi:hypothetical protein